MSTTIDQRVVEMRFDNRNFENNVSTTMSTLDKLKQKLNLDGASKGLENVNTAAKRVDMSALGSAVETVQTKFSALGVMGVTALANITNKAVNAGQRILSALTVDPIKAGFSEYETKIGAIQTIMSNTASKGTTMEDVTRVIGELNTYADKTIYNFAEMTRNIGTFTAAGVGLEDSAAAIQGIANLAAASGSTSQQASTAMYQLSQALSSGTVKLMDWNSVVNAGMGGEKFQEALKATARDHGVAVDDIIKKNGSFRESLQAGWITADILNETLRKFTVDGAKEYAKSMVESGKWTQQQADALIKESQAMEDAATKVKTFTQLWDTLKESAQSGWSQTWEILIGDFEEAKETLTKISDVIGGVINASADARNELLQGWKDAGGRAHLVDSLFNIIKGIGNIVKPIKEAFREFFPPMTVKQLTDFTSKIKELTEQFANAFNPNVTKANRIIGEGKSNVDKLKRTFRGLFAVLDIVKDVFGAVLKAIAPLFGKVDDLGGGILDITANVGDWLVGLNEAIDKSGFFTTAVESIHKAFKKVGEFIKPAIDGIKEFGAILSDSLTDTASRAVERLSPLAVLGNVVKTIFVELGNAIKKIFPFVSSAATGIGNILSDLMGRITDAFTNMNFDILFDTANTGIITAIGVFIAKMFKSGSGIIDNAAGFVENLQNVVKAAGDSLGAFTESLKADTLKKIAIAIAILAGSLLVLSLIPSDQLTTSLVAITTLFGELMGSMSILSKFGDMKDVAKIATAMITLSAALLVLSFALKIMSTMSWSEMGVGLISLTVGLGALVGAVNLLPESKVNGAAKAIKKLSTALLVLAVAIKIMSTMSWEEMGIGLITMVVGLAALVGAVYLLPKDTALRAAGMIGLAAAMVILAAALKIMATMSWEDVAISLVALAGSLLILAGAMNVMMSALPGALAMLVVAPALILLAAALKIMSTMTWEQVAIGLVALAGSMIILAAAMSVMMFALPGAAALAVVMAALVALAPVLMLLGSMSLADIGKSLLMIAGVFAVLGVAALVLQPLVPTILSLAGSLTLLGIACVAIGAGALALGLGLTMIAAAGSGVAVALVTIISSVISLIPYLIEQIGVGIMKLYEVIAGSANVMRDAFVAVVLALVDALTVAIPPLVEGLLVFIVSALESLVNHLPTIVVLLVDLVVKLIEALATQMSPIIAAIFTLMAAIMDGIASNLTILIEPFVNLFGAIFEGIAAVLGPIIETVIAPLMSVLVDLIVGLVEAIAPYIPSIQAMVTAICNAFVFLASQIAPIIDSITNLIKQLGTTIAQILNSIANVIVSIAAVIAVALYGLAAVFDSIFNGIATVITSIGDSIRTVLEGIASVIESISATIETYLNGLSDVFDTVFNGISDVITSVGDSIKTVLDGIAGVIESVGEAALNAGTGFESLANGVKTITNLSLADMVASMTAVAGGIGDIAAHSGGIKTTADSMTKLSSGAGIAASKFAEVTVALSAMMKIFSSADSVMKSVGANLLSNVVEGIENQKSKLATAAKSAIKQFVDAIKNQKSVVKTETSLMAAACANAITDKVGAFKSAGKDLGSGLVIGINAKRTAVYNAAYKLGQLAVQGEHDGQKSGSPSKLTIQEGKWFGEGLIVGITQMGDKVYESASDLGKNAISTLSSTISKISDAINADIDAQPTIRPVLDLSGVRSGVGTIGNMLDMDSSVGVMANVRSISSSMSLNGQNGGNGDVISAIDRLRKDLSNVGSTTYQINGVTYDDGTNVSNTIKDLVRYAKIERRI